MTLPTAAESDLREFDVDLCESVMRSIDGRAVNILGRLTPAEDIRVRGVRGLTPSIEARDVATRDRRP